MIILGTNSVKTAGGFNVDNSVRFNDGDSAYMHKTPSGAGNRRTFTFSAWIKRSGLGAEMGIFTAGADANSGQFFTIMFTDADELNVQFYEGGFQDLKTNRKFRDVSAWYHILVAVYTTQSTAANRIKIYVNGTQESSFASSDYPSEDWDSAVNNTEIQQIGVRRNGSSALAGYYDGYIAEAVLVDGSQKSNTDLGEFDEDSGIWKPIDVSGLTFGTNGFYLDFKASGNLGNDANGGTDLTEVNLAATDQSTDTCTNNFCTINPLVNGIQRNPTLSEGNTFLTNTSGAWMNCMSSFAASSGKWYFEIKPTLHGTSYVHAGIFAVDDWQNKSSGYPNFGGTANSWSYDSDGNIVNNDENEDTNPDTYTTNDIIGIAVDLDNNKFYAYKNNSLQISGGSTITANTEYYFGGMGYNSNIGFNFGNPSYANTSDAADGNGYGAFEFAPPSGFFSINTKNLAEYG